MNVKSAPIYLFALLVLAGCSGQEPKADVVKVDPPQAGSSLDDPKLSDPNPAPNYEPGANSKPNPNLPEKDSTTVDKNNNTIPDPMEPRKVTPEGEQGWAPADIKPEVLAANVAKRMSGMANTECKAVFSSKTPEGVGQNILNYRMSTPTTYRIEYMEPTEKPSRSVIIADGKSVKLYADRKWKAENSVSKGLDPANARLNPDRYLREFSRTVFSPITDKTDAWTPLFMQLTSGAEGFETRIETRTVPYKGRDYKAYRLYAKRTDAEAKRLGPASMEIVIDAKHWLPVTIRTDEEPIGGKTWSYEWAGSWKFGQRFTPDQLGLVFKPMPVKPSI